MSIEEILNGKPIPQMTLQEFFGKDYDKGETFIPHSKNQPVKSPAQDWKQGVKNPKSRLAKRS